MQIYLLFIIILYKKAATKKVPFGTLNLFNQLLYKFVR